MFNVIPIRSPFRGLMHDYLWTVYSSDKGNMTVEIITSFMTIGRESHPTFTTNLSLQNQNIYV